MKMVNPTLAIVESTVFGMNLINSVDMASIQAINTIGGCHWECKIIHSKIKFSPLWTLNEIVYV